jgi:hypothetical protein
MRGTRILFFIIIMFYLFLSIGQNVTSTENFIAYKFPQQADSLLVLQIDSFNQEFVQNAYIVLDLRLSYFITSERKSFDSIISPYYIVNDQKEYYNCVISLHLSENLNSDTTLGGMLAKNTNCYYVSLNRKYKIPIIFSEDDIIRSQFKQYKYSLYYSSGFPLIYIYLMGDKLISSYHLWSVSDAISYFKYKRH